MNFINWNAELPKNFSHLLLEDQTVIIDKIKAKYGYFDNNDPFEGNNDFIEDDNDFSDDDDDFSEGTSNLDYLADYDADYPFEEDPNLPISVQNYLFDTENILPLLNNQTTSSSILLRIIEREKEAIDYRSFSVVFPLVLKHPNCKLEVIYALTEYFEGCKETLFKEQFAQFCQYPKLTEDIIDRLFAILNDKLSWWSCVTPASTEFIIYIINNPTPKEEATIEAVVDAFMRSFYYGDDESDEPACTITEETIRLWKAFKANSQNYPQHIKDLLTAWGKKNNQDIDFHNILLIL